MLNQSNVTSRTSRRHQICAAIFVVLKRFCEVIRVMSKSKKTLSKEELDDFREKQANRGVVCIFHVSIYILSRMIANVLTRARRRRFRIDFRSTTTTHTCKHQTDLLGFDSALYETRKDSKYI